MSLHADLASELQALAFRQISDSTYTVGFERRPGEILYVKKTQKRSVVLDPSYFREGDIISGVRGYSYWNSNLHTFPKAMRNGKSAERHGIAFDIPTPGHVRHLAAELEVRL